MGWDVAFLATDRLGVAAVQVDRLVEAYLASASRAEEFLAGRTSLFSRVVYVCGLVSFSSSAVDAIPVPFAVDELRALSRKAIPLKTV